MVFVVLLRRVLFGPCRRGEEVGRPDHGRAQVSALLVSYTGIIHWEGRTLTKKVEGLHTIHRL